MIKFIPEAFHLYLHDIYIVLLQYDQLNRSLYEGGSVQVMHIKWELSVVYIKYIYTRDALHFYIFIKNSKGWRISY